MSGEARAAFGAAAPPSRPSRSGYWLGGTLMVLAVAGAVVWVVLGFVRFGDAVDDLARVPVGTGGGVVQLSAGEKAIYYEADDAQQRVPAMRISIVAVEDRAEVRIGEHSGSVSYSLGGHTGESVAAAQIPRDGRYLVTGEDDGVAPSDAQLAIGEGVGSRIVGILAGGFAIFLGGGLLGAVCLIVTSTCRRRAAQGAAGVALPIR